MLIDRDGKECCQVIASKSDSDSTARKPSVRKLFTNWLCNFDSASYLLVAAYLGEMTPQRMYRRTSINSL